MAEFVRTHQACPCGDSWQGFSERADGSGFCFSCSKSFFADELGNERNEMDEDAVYGYTGNWNISKRTMEFYGVETKFVNDVAIAEAYPYPNGAVKIRDLLKDKSAGENVFSSQGPMKDAGLFGMDRFDPGSKEAIVLTEGEKDAMSVYEMFNGRVAAVSVRSSSSALRDCRTDWEKINSFKKIYICFDSDKPGQDAVKSLQGLFDFKKVYLVKMTRWKDANEYLVAGEIDDFINTVRASKRYAPDNIISSFTEIDKALNESQEDCLGMYPFHEVQTALYGLHRGEVIVVKAPEGVGKTEFFRTLEYHLLKTTSHGIGIIHLEEDNATTIKAIAGYELEVPAVLPDCGLSKQDILDGYKKAVRDDEGRLHIHSSFDVEDEDAFLGNIRFLVSAAGCSFIFLDHITWLATGLADEDERKKLDRISQKLKLLAKELRFCLVMISHVNDDGKTRGSRNISKVANTVISLDRDLLGGSTAMFFLIEKARMGGRTGPAGKAIFNREKGKLEPFVLE